MHKLKPVIYVGYDLKDHRGYEVLVHSIKKYNDKYNIVPLMEPTLRRIGLYRRSYRVFSHDTKQRYDQFDNKPFSTDFTFTRFLVPALNQYQGWALFMDCDMLVRADIDGIFKVYNDESYAAYCVKHKYEPPEGTKLDGVAQTRYRRKNWSSLVLYNCSHPSNLALTVDAVNLQSGSWLHSFGWLMDDEIGSIHQEWNWLDGHSDPNTEAKNVHFTTGGPWFPEWKPSRPIDEAYAEEWKKTEQEIETQLILETL